MLFQLSKHLQVVLLEAKNSYVKHIEMMFLLGTGILVESGKLEFAATDISVIERDTA